VAIREGVFAQATPEVQGLKLRAARALNALVGRQSPSYQQQAGDPPGADGRGALRHVERLQALIEPHARGDERLRPLLFALQQVRGFGEEARVALVETIRSRDPRAPRSKERGKEAKRWRS